MGRLTWKKENGEWGLHGYDIKKVPTELYGTLCKLKDYEELGTVEECQKAREKEEAVYPVYLGENVSVGYRSGRCICGNVAKSYQNYCDCCGVRLDWSGCWKEGLQ